MYMCVCLKEMYLWRILKKENELLINEVGLLEENLFLRIIF